MNQVLLLALKMSFPCAARHACHYRLVHHLEGKGIDRIDKIFCICIINTIANKGKSLGRQNTAVMLMLSE